MKYFKCYHRIEIAVKKGHNEYPETAKKIPKALKAFSTMFFETREYDGNGNMTRH